MTLSAAAPTNGCGPYLLPYPFAATALAALPMKLASDGPMVFLELLHQLPPAQVARLTNLI